MRQGARIGRIFGIDITIDWSWFVIAALMVTHLTVLFRAWHPLWSTGLALGVAVAATGILFVCILLHELAHSLVAMAQGMRVRGIRFFLFGGVSQLEREHASAGREITTAMAGPLTSFLLGGVFLSVFAVLWMLSPQTVASSPVGIVPRLGPLATLLLWAGTANMGLAIFNLVPAFPLDGGRVLRGLLWWISDDAPRATVWASVAGQAIAGLFIAAGIAMAFGASFPLLGGGLVGGLWLCFIGWFLLTAASQSRRLASVETALEPIEVSHVMRTEVPSLAADQPVRLVLEGWVRDERDAYVVTRDGEAVGLVSLELARAVSADDWAEEAVGNVMRSFEEVPTVRPEQDAATALRVLLESDLRAVPVVRDGRCLGMVHLRDLLRWVDVQDAGPFTWSAHARAA